MKRDIVFLKPIFKEMIWGGDRLSDFGYEIPSDKTGECWAIAAHKNGDCEIVGAEYGGMRLSELWKNEPAFFGNMYSEEFPLLVKIIDANDDLSIQVHPNDEYAGKNEGGSLGKTECWYVLDCKEGAGIVVGHNARDKAELEDMIRGERWGELIREIPIKKGDFFQIEPGVLHAIKAGTLILETQQSSDITYRVYDYGRLQNGSPRELHVEKSIDVIEAPYASPCCEKEILENGAYRREILIRCKYYTVERLDVTAPAALSVSDGFVNASIISGSGSIDGRRIKKGDHFIIPANYGKADLDGEFSAILSYL